MQKVSVIAYEECSGKRIPRVPGIWARAAMTMFMEADFIEKVSFEHEMTEVQSL
jgi:hypothetical protein